MKAPIYLHTAVTVIRAGSQSRHSDGTREASNKKIAEKRAKWNETLLWKINSATAMYFGSIFLPYKDRQLSSPFDYAHWDGGICSDITEV